MKLLLELASIMHGLSHAYFTVRTSQDSKHTKPTRVHALLPVTFVSMARTDKTAFSHHVHVANPAFFGQENEDTAP